MRIPVLVALSLVLPSMAAATCDSETYSSNPAYLSHLPVQDFSDPALNGSQYQALDVQPWSYEGVEYWHSSGSVSLTTCWGIPGMDAANCGDMTQNFIQNDGTLSMRPAQPASSMGFRWGTQGSSVSIEVELSDGSMRSFTQFGQTGFFGYCAGEHTIARISFTSPDGGIDDVRHGDPATVPTACVPDEPQTDPGPFVGMPVETFTDELGTASTSVSSSMPLSYDGVSYWGWWWVNEGWATADMQGPQLAVSTLYMQPETPSTRVAFDWVAQFAGANITLDLSNGQQRTYTLTAGPGGPETPRTSTATATDSPTPTRRSTAPIPWTPTPTTMAWATCSRCSSAVTPSTRTRTWTDSSIWRRSSSTAPTPTSPTRTETRSWTARRSSCTVPTRWHPIPMGMACRTA